MMLNPYLNLNGTTEEAFKLYRTVFGGELSSLMRYKEMPGSERFSESEGEMIAHIALPVGGVTLMGGDTLESTGQKANFGNNVYIMITPDSEAEANRLFNELLAGGGWRCRWRVCSGATCSARSWTSSAYGG